MDKDTASLIEQVKEIDTDTFFLLFYIIATVLGIGRNFLLRENLIIGQKPNEPQIDNIEIAIPAILLIARGYFLKENIKDYLNNPNRYNLNYVIVAILIFSGTIIDLYTNIIEPSGGGNSSQF